jgi:heat shock protein beta
MGHLERGLLNVAPSLKEEAYDFLEQDTVRELIKKYSQFINFNIYLWGSKTEEVEEPIEEEEEETEKKEEVRGFWNEKFKKICVSL